MANNIYIRFPEYAREEEHPEWMTFIWKCNASGTAIFGKPKYIDWPGGGEAEDYRHARVIFMGDMTVRIVSKTPLGVKIMKKAADEMKVSYSPVFQDVPMTP